MRSFSDEYKNLKIPFVNIVRNPDTKYGTNPSLIYNIPTGRHYTYAEVPTWDGNRKGVDIYQIPQPIPVDIMYSVRIFAYRQQELNKFNSKYFPVPEYKYSLVQNQIDEKSFGDEKENEFYKTIQMHSKIRLCN
jgi:hypothetical protein